VETHVSSTLFRRVVCGMQRKGPLVDAENRYTYLLVIHHYSRRSSYTYKVRTASRSARMGRESPAPVPQIPDHQGLKNISQIRTHTSPRAWYVVSSALCMMISPPSTPNVSFTSFRRADRPYPSRVCSSLANLLPPLGSAQSQISKRSVRV
jgi:hypothetical protein